MREADPTDFILKLKKALALDFPYPEMQQWEKWGRTQNLKITPASVLVAFSNETPSQLLITQRTEQVEKHKGQMAFPGGVHETGESDVQAALREAQEEVGLDPKSIEILGELPPLWTSTGYWVRPVVGVFDRKLQALTPNPNEIAEILWIPWIDLTRPSVYRSEKREFQGQVYDIHVFQIEQYRIWGATGAMIKNLLDRMQEIG